MDSHLTTNQFSHNHGEEQKKHIHRMDLKTHLGNGLIRKHWFKNTIDIIITTKLRILVMKASMKRSMDSHLPTNQFSQNHGEELRRLTHKMDSKTQPGNGLIRKLWSKNTIDTIITIRHVILETKALLKKSMASHLPISQFYHNHGEEQRKLIQ